MKQFLLSAIWVVFLFLLYSDVNAQRGRVYRSYPVYRSQPMVAIRIGGIMGGYYGPRVWGYGWGPRVGVNVVLPPPGARVGSLPPGSVKKEINGIIYYYRNNVYYRENEDGGFEVVDAPVGATVTRIPIGAKLQKVDGKYYYEKDGTFYYKDVDEEGRTFYTIVGKNGNLHTDGIFNSHQNENHEKYHDLNTDAKEIGDNTTKQDGDDTYTIRPEVGDRFEQLPRNSHVGYLDGEKVYISPNNIYYKEVKEGDDVWYEVIKNK